MIFIMNKKYLNKQESANYLSISLSVLDKEIESGNLKFSRLGDRTFRISLIDLDRFMNENKQS